MLMHEDVFYESYIHSQMAPDQHHGKGLSSRISIGEALKDNSVARVFATASEPFTILHVNSAWCTLFGYRAEDALGRSLPAFQAADIGEGCSMFKALEQGLDSVNNTVEIAHASGTMMLCQQTMIPIQSSASSVGMLLVEMTPCTGSFDNLDSDCSSEEALMDATRRACEHMSLAHSDGMEDEDEGAMYPSTQSSGFDFDDDEDSSEFDEDFCDPENFVAYSFVELPLPQEATREEVEAAMLGLVHSGLLRSFEINRNWAALHVDLETVRAHFKECDGCKIEGQGGRGFVRSAAGYEEESVQRMWRALFCLHRYVDNSHDNCMHSACAQHVEASDLGFLAGLDEDL